MSANHRFLFAVVVPSGENMSVAGVPSSGGVACSAYIEIVPVVVAIVVIVVAVIGISSNGSNGSNGLRP